MNKQREIIYGQRKQVLDGMDIRDVIVNMISSIITSAVTTAFRDQKRLGSPWRPARPRSWLSMRRESWRSVPMMKSFPKRTFQPTDAALAAAGPEQLIEMFTGKAMEFYAAKEAEIAKAKEANPNFPDMRELERVVMLQVVDEYWMEHIDAMQDLRQGIRLRAYAQTNPVDAYKSESLHMFEEMISAIQEETVRRLYSVRIRSDQEVKRRQVADRITEGRGDGTVKKQPRRVQKIGRLAFFLLFGYIFYHSQEKKATKLFGGEIAFFRPVPGAYGRWRPADAECAGVSATDIPGILAFARANAVDFAVVAPDDPLVLGAVDALEEAGIPCFGPRKNAAIIEGSKVFSKNLMEKYHIPTAACRIFDAPGEALAYVDECPLPAVVKADGLALGKGVLICETRESAREAVRSIMEDRIFGESGAKVVIEEFLTGPEVSVLAFTDGTCVKPMVSSMDHKRALDGDRGLNTGGMGAVAPNPCYTEAVAARCMEEIFLPTIRAMKAEGRPFRGCLYCQNGSGPPERRPAPRRRGDPKPPQRPPAPGRRW